MRRHLNLIATLFIAFSCMAQTPLPPKTPAMRAHELFTATSTQFLKDMDRDKAFIGYTQVIAVDPSYAPAWFNLGVLAEAANKWQDASSYFGKYLTLAPTGPYAARAGRELKVTEQRMAHPAPTKAQQYNAIIDRARALADTNFYKEAIDEAGQAQTLDPTRWEAYAIVSVVMYKQHNNAEGKRFATLALDRTPLQKKNAVAHVLVPQP
jgi:tetratricopeptide (TPR) repeat protein